MSAGQPRSQQALAAEEWGRVWLIGVGCGVVIGLAIALVFGRMT